MAQRVTFRRRHAYNTKSNKKRQLRTPGGKLTIQYLKKKARSPKCGDCGEKIHGVKALRPKVYRTLKKRQRSVSRPYGGSRCAGCVRMRIIRAFLTEEQKIVKNVLKQRGAKD
eukprot:71804_1